jgi:hypothetical protein
MVREALDKNPWNHEIASKFRTKQYQALNPGK